MTNKLKFTLNSVLSARLSLNCGLRVDWTIRSAPYLCLNCVRNFGLNCFEFSLLPLCATRFGLYCVCARCFCWWARLLSPTHPHRVYAQLERIKKQRFSLALLDWFSHAHTATARTYMRLELNWINWAATEDSHTIKKPTVHQTHYYGATTLFPPKPLFYMETQQKHR